MVSGQPLAVLALAKGAAHWTVCGLPLVLISPLIAGGLGVPGSAICTLMLSIGLGTGILSALGAIGSALTLGLRRGSLLLSLLVLPLAMPARFSAPGGGHGDPRCENAGVPCYCWPRCWCGRVAGAAGGRRCA